MAGDPAALLPPGFRFHPTDEELILHYLRNQATSQPCPVSIIAEVDIYKCDPWDLPAKAMFGDQEWYFFSPRDRKYPNGVRPNRAAASGYWKATGTDKPIRSSRGDGHIGVKKALVFYKGKPPKGHKTSWIMHEYRLAETRPSNAYRPAKFSNTSMRLDDWVLCRIYKKHSSCQEEPTISPADRERERELIGHTSNFEIANDGSTLRLPKSLSVSDFLEGAGAAHGLLDTLPEQVLLAEQPKQRGREESSASVSANYTADAEIQFKDEFSALEQTQRFFFFDHQLLLNPYLGSH